MGSLWNLQLVCTFFKCLSLTKTNILFDQIHFTQEEEEDMKMDLGDFLEVLVKEEEGEGKEEQETGVLNVSPAVKNESRNQADWWPEAADCREVRWDQEQARWPPDPQPERPGQVSRDSWWDDLSESEEGDWQQQLLVPCCEVKLRRGQRQKMRDHVEAKHVDRVQHWCTAKHCKTPCKTSASLAQHILNKHWKNLNYFFPQKFF